ncbi:zinc-dependent alcohol dehydrogenase [Bacillus sp. SG-1]|uniref:zinc-dependent alcohol dehydrogenase n=1 Tax=Bacillus sp. SG-1 TaxID=161544 RepID=UPI0001544FFE|nr:zinc-binding alcohol dehydrogenase [Bacillus sp. SG-1]EDL64527.1 Zn-dependent alcohol dehydrogenase and related dehydrogenase [Bacillus sp. SG-1]
MIQQSLELTGKQKLEWRRHKLGPLQKDEVLIQTIAGAISIGAALPEYDETDVTDPIPEYPRKAGYESYGKVIEVGQEVTDVKIGDYVLAFYGHKKLGIEKAHKVVRVPKAIDSSYALLNILSCDAAKGVLKLNPQPASRVLIIGAGTMGLLTVHFLKNYMKVEQVDILEPDFSRGGFAESFGATNVYNKAEQVPDGLYDYGLECSASIEGFHVLLKSMKKHGDICILSDGNKDLFYLNEDFYEKELRIVGSSDGWDYRKHSEWFFQQLDEAPYLNKIFDYTISSDQLIECYANLSDGNLKPLKVLVKY